MTLIKYPIFKRERKRWLTHCSFDRSDELLLLSSFTVVGIQLFGALPPPSAPECGSDNRSQ